MRKLLMGLLVLSSPLFAILSPLDQSVKEFQTLVASPELRDSFPTSETVQDIWRLGNRFIVSSENRQVTVEVVYSSSKQVGPQEFSFNFLPAKPYTEKQK